MGLQAGTVYATDAILSVLMAAAKSVNSWDLVLRKEGNNLIFDKRPESKIGIHNFSLSSAHQPSAEG